jgi:hypothetical protein
MQRLLDVKLAAIGTRPALDDAKLVRIRQTLAKRPIPSRASDEHLDRIARALASRDARLSALAEEVLAELTPRRWANRVIAELARPQTDTGPGLRDPQPPG